MLALVKTTKTKQQQQRTSLYWAVEHHSPRQTGLASTKKNKESDEIVKFKMRGIIWLLLHPVIPLKDLMAWTTKTTSSEQKIVFTEQFTINTISTNTMSNNSETEFHLKGVRFKRVTLYNNYSLCVCRHVQPPHWPESLPPVSGMSTWQVL